MKDLFSSKMATFDVQCPICKEDFSALPHHIPVVTPCGHSICYKCSFEMDQQLAFEKECVICKRRFMSFVTNYSLLGCIEAYTVTKRRLQALKLAYNAELDRYPLPVYIKGIPKRATKEHVLQFFEKYGVLETLEDESPALQLLAPSYIRVNFRDLTLLEIFNVFHYKCFNIGGEVVRLEVSPNAMPDENAKKILTEEKTPLKPKPSAVIEEEAMRYAWESMDREPSICVTYCIFVAILFGVLILMIYGATKYK